MPFLPWKPEKGSIHRSLGAHRRRWRDRYGDPGERKCEALPQLHRQPASDRPRQPPAGLLWLPSLAKLQLEEKIANVQGFSSSRPSYTDRVWQTTLKPKPSVRCEAALFVTLALRNHIVAVIIRLYRKRSVLSLAPMLWQIAKLLKIYWFGVLTLLHQCSICVSYNR